MVGSETSTRQLYASHVLHHIVILRCIPYSISPKSRNKIILRCVILVKLSVLIVRKKVSMLRILFHSCPLTSVCRS